MIMRFTLSTALALALTTAACARDAASDSGHEATAATSGVAVTQENAVAGPAEPAAFEFPDEAWRTVDQDRLLYIDTDHGMIVVELAPEFAPNHVARMRELASERFYDFLVWHRVIDGFMAQAGGSRANPGHAADKPPLEAEFTIRRIGEPAISELQDRVVNPGQIPQMAKAGFWNGFHAGTQTAALAGITGDGGSSPGCCTAAAPPRWRAPTTRTRRAASSTSPPAAPITSTPSTRSGAACATAWTPSTPSGSARRWRIRTSVPM